MQRRNHSNTLQPLQFLSHVGGMLLGKVLSEQLITCHTNILVLQLWIQELPSLWPRALSALQRSDLHFPVRELKGSDLWPGDTTSSFAKFNPTLFFLKDLVLLALLVLGKLSLQASWLSCNR